MGARLRALSVFLVVLGAGVFLGSGIAEWLNGSEPPAPAGGVGGAAPPPGRVRVEVLNAGGREGMARAATDLLRDRGFDVVYFGNAERFDQRVPVVIDRVGRLAAARSVADVLGIRTVRSEPDANLFVDVSVRIGTQWAPPVVEGEGERAPWWDLRRFWPRGAPGGAEPPGPGPGEEPRTSGGERDEA